MDTVSVTAAAPSVAVANESRVSAVSWAAIIAGTAAALALGIVLTALAAGLGLTTISAWPTMGASATTFAISTGIGLIVVQWLCSALGGFITGRLRTKWVGLHSHEVFFRDTAHGFLSWTVTTIIGAAFLASATGALVSGGAHAVSSVAGGAAQAAASSASSGSSGGVSSYTVDTLFRSDRTDANQNSQEAAAQATRILANGVVTGQVPQDDRAYLAQLVAARTGLSQADAQKRVDDAIAATSQAATKARAAADAARKAAANLAIFTALSLMIGAFIASVAAAYGGRIRDEY
ncbi:hypothetical protein [Rhodopila sp.]|jgi:hypothetical protein|uniref:hypothetical protein n=1 Tax=Rhodopila sp. TaxID=2480087 RepID=UPI002CB261BB|nr:hypothetical protein [Rhodopila sp.]HVZ10116.1 hypothetical protein [Rhodopila sp.]